MTENVRDIVQFGRFRLLPHRGEFLADGVPVQLGSRALGILKLLIEARGDLVTKDEILARVWPETVVEESNLQVQISALRKALGNDRGYIRTISGRGYRFVGEIDTSVQVVTPEGAHAAPATNIPSPTTDLIGRDVELADVANLVEARRMVTLTGAGGIGKTRLAFEVARHLLPRFADGVWAIELAPLSDPELVPVTAATALGLELASGLASPLSVANALRSKQLLLVLDDCEHVVGAAAALAEALLGANPRIHVLATSREPLRVEGEHIFPVPPLAVPAEGSHDMDHLLRHGAIQLFVDRAKAASRHFGLDARRAAMVGAICRLLDGIPLAIELAASRAAALGVEEIAARLDNRFALLARGRRTALPRHQTLRATLDWSYELLIEPERVVLRRLAIFAGYFTLQSASAVAADDEIAAAEVVDCVANLVAKSLVTTDAGGERLRYRLLETTRAYSLEKLVQAGEFDTAARRHAERYRDLFESAEAEAEAETRPTDEWLADYVPRIDSLHAALDWAFSPGGDASIGVALTAAAVPLWMHLSLMEECSSRVERALAAIEAGVGRDSRREMQLHAALTESLIYTRGAVSEVGAAGTKALEIAESLDNVEYQLRSLWGLWSFYINCSQQCVALTLAQRFCTLAVKRSGPNDRLTGERMIGTSQYFLGDLLSARRHLERVLAHYVAPARKWQIIRFEVDQGVAGRTYLARILWLQGLPDQAMRTAESSVTEARTTDHAISLGLALALAACPIALLVGDLTAAEHYLEMLLDHSTRHALARWRAFGRSYQGVLLIERGDLSIGLQLLRGGFDEPGAAGSVPRFFTFLMAEALGRAGRIADGLAAIEEAIVRSEQSDERWVTAELLRIKGELFLLQGAPGAAAAAEGHFRQGLDWARRQGALSWELRCAASLARLWRNQARSNEARELLAPVYGRFTEGFDTADLKAAKALLDDLSPKGARPG